jgi:hypothetical protein
MKPRGGTVLETALALLLSAGSSGAAGPSGAYTITDDLRKALAEQAEKEPRESGTAGDLDWRYTLPEGVATRQVTFYSDDTACYGKLFLPKGFSESREAGKRYPAVVLGHGFNAISIALEKYGARFAEAGIVAMAIDYRGYGFSDPWVELHGPDPTAGTPGDGQRRFETTTRVRLVRTRLLAMMQAEDYRSAISYLQGEPGVDPERIGIWGSSHAGGVVITVAGTDARVKAVVAQVSGVGGRGRTGPTALEGALLEDAIARARTGHGGEYSGGFSFRGLIDVETRQTGREHRPWAALAKIPETTAILWLPAEKDELIPPRGPSGPFEASKEFKGNSEVLEIPHITHFQVYSGPAFEVSSGAAAEWFARHLGGVQ